VALIEHKTKLYQAQLAAMAKDLIERGINILESDKHYRWSSWKRDAKTHLGMIKNLEAVMSPEPQSKP